MRPLYNRVVRVEDARQQQIEHLQERMAKAVRKQPLLADLYELLLSIGGVAIVADYEPDVQELLERGRRFPVRGLRMKRGYPSACHFNVAQMHEKRGVGVATGYALSDDDLWRPHSWGYQGGKVVETTEPRQVYFGFLMKPEEAADFCEANLA